MLRTSESETEILLGNKQLLAIFFALAALLGVAFYGGYMVGRGTSARKVIASASPNALPTSTAANQNATGGETHTFPADTSTGTGQSANAPAANTNTVDTSSDTSTPRPLGSRPGPGRTSAPATDTAADNSTWFTPAPGEKFLQVAAVGKDEAEAVADVLQKKGFKAHAVPKPGNAKIYRVLIGPIQDAADLSSTRDALRRTGFREVIVQTY